MALIPSSYLDACVSIGVRGSEGMRYIGTGFVYGHLHHKEGHRSMYVTYLVTTRHVLNGKREIVVRVNPNDDEGPAREFGVALQDKDGNQLWIGHEDDDVDVAAVRVDLHLLKDQGVSVDLFQSDVHVANMNKATDLGVTEGDGVFVLGFPMGMESDERSYVIVRHGIISRIRDALRGQSKEFFVDSFVYPGNSGGPVILRPSPMAVVGTKTIDTAYLIGIVKSYVPYRDVAISQHTKRPRVIFEENTGLASVIPIDFVQQAIQRSLLAKEAASGTDAQWEQPIDVSR